MTGTPRDYRQRTKHTEARLRANRHFLDWAKKRIYQRPNDVVQVLAIASLEPISVSPKRVTVQVVVVGQIRAYRWASIRPTGHAEQSAKRDGDDAKVHVKVIPRRERRWQVRQPK
ncbi:MAG: hypothetical protein E4H01_08005 [Lysobacterales bacterium]|nr:MAG: hypothetical protein E4H01_08005 [Xanthomonadales bacterium]